MAGKKISELIALGANFVTTDLFEISKDDGGGSYSSKKITGGELSSSVVAPGTGGTAGSVLFADASAQIGQDNANFFWDDTSNRLGIGTDSPNVPLDVVKDGGIQQQWSYDGDSRATMTVADDSHTTVAVGETGNLTLDVGGDIELNADGGDITFKDASVTLAAIDNIGSVTVTGGQIAINRKLAITSTTVADFDGDAVYFGTGTTVAGNLYNFKSDGSWEITVCTSAAACDGLIAVALGTAPATHGMLLRGMVTLNAIEGTEAVGDILYLSETTNGAADCVAPVATGEIVRIIGYCLHITEKTIWFNPDSTYVELA